MKRRHVLILVVVFAALGFPWQMAAAQDPSLTVEFPFAAAGKLMNAGTYAVTTTASGHVLLTSEGGTGTELPALRSVNRSVDRAELVFERVGSVWILSEVSLPGQGRKIVGKVEYSEDRKSVKGPRTR